MLEQLIQELARDLELDEIPFMEKEGYFLPLEEDVSVSIKALPPGPIQGFILSSTLAPCPKVNREAFFTQTLLANLFGQGTHHAVLGVSEDGNSLVLTRVIDYEIEYKDFKNAVEDFINMVDYWRAEALNQK